MDIKLIQKAILLHYDSVIALYETPEEALSREKLLHILSILLGLSLEEIESFLQAMVTISEDDPEATTEDWIDEYLNQDEHHKTI